MADEFLSPEHEDVAADEAVARGELAEARRLLAGLVTRAPERAEAWLKLASMCRALGDLEGAMHAVSGALRVDSLGFLPLLLKASLLDAVGRRNEAGEAYGHALAQRPPKTPNHLAGIVALAEQRHAEHIAAAAGRLAEAAAGVTVRPAEAGRMARFQSNVLRTTTPYHSEPTHFHYPELRECEFHDREAFPWLTGLEQQTAAIRDEFNRLLLSEHAELVPYIQYPDHVPLGQWAALNRSRNWSAIHIYQNGNLVEANARHCPLLLESIASIEQPRIGQRSPNVMFSLLGPGAHIPPHTGVANTRLVCHLPLIVPEGCWFRVGAQTRTWREGEAWIFDDTIEHEASNPTGQLRVILILDLWHPDLSQAERRAVAAVMEASYVDGAGGL